MTSLMKHTFKSFLGLLGIRIVTLFLKDRLQTINDPSKSLNWPSENKLNPKHLK